MNSKQLQYAIKLSETLNFSQVADMMHISQPALSKQILNLEQELGVKLFDRSTIPMTITPAGERFISSAKDLLYRQDQLKRAMNDFRTDQRGKLVIGISPFRSQYLIPDIIKQVNNRFPGVQITLHEVASDILRKEAAEGKYDFALINLPVDEAVLDIIPLEPDRLVLAVPKGLCHLLPDGGPLGFRDCRELPFVVVGQTQEMRRLFDKLCAAAEFQPKIAVEVGGLTTAWSMARAGIGATLLPLQYINHISSNENLALFSLQDLGSLRQPVIVTRRGQHISKFAQYAIGLLSDTCAKKHSDSD